LYWVYSDIYQLTIKIGDVSRDVRFKPDPLGVKSDPCIHYVHLWSNKKRCNHFHYEKEKNVGVRDDDHIYYIKYLQKRNELSYPRPCVCGSCEHRNIHHKDCLLNPMYDDI
jgi:hypothetical protein